MENGHSAGAGMDGEDAADFSVPLLPPPPETFATRLWAEVGRRARQGLGLVMKAGPMPRHVAFIMDGNRRYAERLRRDRLQGHQFGYQKLIDALEWCLELGITHTSVYAFSIENFKRSPEEVATLMYLAEVKLQELLTERAMIDRNGVQIRVLGDLNLLPPAVKAVCAQVVDATRANNRCVLNFCFPYTSRHDMTQAVESVRRSVSRGDIMEEDVDAAVLERHLLTQDCPPVDLVIRTSGEKRLSDFLLWQSAHALLHFSPVLWPDFSFLDLLMALLAYQRATPTLAGARAAAARDVRPTTWAAAPPLAADPPAGRGPAQAARAAAAASAPRRRRAAGVAADNMAPLEWAGVAGHDDEPVPGCACCVVRQLRFHAACSEPVPGLQALMRKKQDRDAAARMAQDSLGSRTPA